MPRRTASDNANIILGDTLVRDNVGGEYKPPRSDCEKYFHISSYLFYDGDLGDFLFSDCYAGPKRKSCPDARTVSGLRFPA